MFLLFSAHLHEQLTDYMKAYSMVKIVRMPERVGLIRARLAGLPESTAEVVTYLDSHCECTKGKIIIFFNYIYSNNFIKLLFVSFNN